MTPRKYAALSEAHDYAMKQREILFAQLTAATINYSMSRPREPVGIASLMPSNWEIAPRRRRVSSKGVVAKLRAMVASYQQGYKAKP